MKSGCATWYSSQPSASPCRNCVNWWSSRTRTPPRRRSGSSNGGLARVPRKNTSTLQSPVKPTHGPGRFYTQVERPRDPNGNTCHAPVSTWRLQPGNEDPNTPPLSTTTGPNGNTPRVPAPFVQAILATLVTKPQRGGPHTGPAWYTSDHTGSRMLHLLNRT